MKKTILMIMMIFICFLLVACNDVKVDKKTHAMQERDLYCIKVSSLPQTRDYTLRDESAYEIYDYFKKLKTEYYSNENDLNGITYIITIEYENGDIKTLYHSAYLIGTEDSWYKIKNYKQQEFEKILEKLSK